MQDILLIFPCTYKDVVILRSCMYMRSRILSCYSFSNELSLKWVSTFSIMVCRNSSQLYYVLPSWLNHWHSAESWIHSFPFKYFFVLLCKWHCRMCFCVSRRVGELNIAFSHLEREALDGDILPSEAMTRALFSCFK